MHANRLRELEDRFIRYVKINTQSDLDSTQVPSSARQLDLSRLLADELRALGARDVVLNQYGYVLATIPATDNSPEDVPVVAFLAHVDTAPDFSGDGVRPIVHRDYAGGSIVLPDAPDLVLGEADEPDLKDKRSEDIVTASGTTLLGADDKAGVAIVMTLAAELLADSSFPHGHIRLCFTPDEEIGHGVDHLNLNELAANVAYTIDGGEAGEVVYETFSADLATVVIEGVAIHPGDAKGRMVNALRLAGRLIESLPWDTCSPETTEGYQGFIHLHRMQGDAARVELQLLLRDFELQGLQARQDTLRSICSRIQVEEPRCKITCKVVPQYRNMRYWLEKDMRPVDLAVEAVEMAGMAPRVMPTRGGTDGSRLTEMGLPTPNIFTGTHNMHGPREWVSLQDMAAAVETCFNLVQLWRQKGRGYRGWRG